MKKMSEVVKLRGKGGENDAMMHNQVGLELKKKKKAILIHDSFWKEDIVNLLLNRAKKKLMNFRQMKVAIS